MVSIGALVALGCGGERSATPAAAPGAAPAAPPGETASAAPGATAGQPAAPAAIADVWSSTLPEDFPPDVPIYPPSQLVRSQEIPDTGVKVGWTTTDDVDKVASFYSDSLAAKGWATRRVNGDDGSLVFADKGARSLTFVIGSGPGTTTIDLLLVQTR
jgi:hypothetical protein